MKNTTKRMLALTIALLLALSTFAFADAPDDPEDAAQVEETYAPEPEADPSDDVPYEDAGEAGDAVMPADTGENGDAGNADGASLQDGDAHVGPVEVEGTLGGSDFEEDQEEVAEVEGDFVSDSDEDALDEFEEPVYGAAGDSLDLAAEIALYEAEVDSVTAYGDAENDALLDAYVQRMIDASLDQRVYQEASYAAKARLTGVDGAVYAIFADAIQEIAAGSRESTVIEITTDALKAKGINCGPWSAAELGVASTTTKNDEGNTIIAPAASSVVNAKMEFSIKNVMGALLADYPYELYWYDKVSGSIPVEGSKSSVEASKNSTTGEFELSYGVNIAYCMTVANRYAGSGAYTVNTNIINSANTAIANAKTIVENHRNDGTVLKRLQAYKDAICKLVTYNHDAANNASTPYGDPWQLIYVFDGNESTNVVCEGYSKAFKYLFDLSKFDDSFDCILATGKMGGENHMWNVVRMNDDRNYLVDVTNCDTGAIGAPNKLFMAYGPSGSWNDTYTFDIGGGVRYWYDETTRATFAQDQLVLSDSAYEGRWAIYIDSGIAHGKVTANCSEATQNTIVTLTVTPDSGYVLKSLTAVDGKGRSVTVSGNVFTMPNATVRISAAFAVAATPTPVPAATPAPAAPAAPAAPVAAVPAPAPTTPTITATSNTKATVNAGTVYQIDTGAKAGKTFKSSNKKIATVDKNGVVTVKKSGKVKITFKVGKKKRTVTLKVVDPTIPTSVSLNMGGTVAVKRGDSVTLTAALPAGTNSGIKWKSSNKKVATVSNGVVTFKKAGKVTITATAARGKKKAKVTFRVSK